MKNRLKPTVLILLIATADIYGRPPATTQDSVTVIDTFVERLGIGYIIDGQCSQYITAGEGMPVILKAADYNPAEHKLVIQLGNISIKKRKATVEASQYPPDKNKIFIKMCLRKIKGEWVLRENHRKNQIVII